ncbi:unnamed protein product, partial [Ectocarpus sp. 4 AP-2014]
VLVYIITPSHNLPKRQRHRWSEGGLDSRGSNVQCIVYLGARFYSRLQHGEVGVAFGVRLRRATTTEKCHEPTKNSKQEGVYMVRSPLTHTNGGVSCFSTDQETRSVSTCFTP